MRKSKLEPYADEIVTWLNAGATYREMSEMLLEKYDYDVAEPTICQFVLSKGLHSKVMWGNNKMGRVFIPRCDHCESCDTVRGFGENTTLRLCLKEKRLISGVVKTSPMWCQKREVNGNVRLEVDKDYH